MTATRTVVRNQVTGTAYAGWRLDRSGSLRHGQTSPYTAPRTKVAVPARTTTESEVDALDVELAELRQLLDRLDGLTHQARTRLRRIEQHRNGVDPRWIDRAAR